MQQVQIPVPPGVNISMTSAVWKKVCTGQTFFQFLHGSSQKDLLGALEVSRMMSAQHVFQSLLVSDLGFPLLFTFHPLAIKICPSL
jgi:hypothetical protein